jgi:hypothetical protein
VTDVSMPPASQSGHAPTEPDTAPLPREPELPTTQIHSSAVQSGERCPSCGAPLAADQRYCLECGQRRGDPRLPFMDAVVLMDAVKRPKQATAPPPKKKRTGISPNAALIAGIGVLLLALGVGVLIGRSGNHGTTSAAPAAPIVIHGGGEEGTTASSKGGATTGGGAASKAKTKKQKAAAEKEAEAHPASEEVLKPSGNAKPLPPAKIKPGGKCEAGVAGCEHGEFTGNFFGE